MRISKFSGPACAAAALLSTAVAEEPAPVLHIDEASVVAPQPPTAAELDDVPEAARAMLEAAARTEDAAQVAAVSHAAATVFPDHAATIEAYGDYLRAVIFPATGRDIETLFVRHTIEEPTPPPAPEIRTADQDLKGAPAPKFLDLGDWTGNATASGLVSSGNSENAAAGLLVEAHLPDGDFTHNMRAYFDYGRSQGVKNQQRWGGSYKLDYVFDERTFAYARISYDEDEFSGFDYRLFGGFGVGHKLILNEAVALKVEGGPGYQYAPIDVTREVDSQFAFYASGEFDWVIRDGLKFEQDMNATWTEPTTTIISTSTLTAAFTDTLSTGLSYIYRYETSPPEGRFDTDRTLRINLTYGF